MKNALAEREDADFFEVLWLKNPKRENSRGDTDEQNARGKIAQLKATDVLAISLLGTYHNIIGLLQHQEPFDFFEPDNENIDPEAQLIPYAAMRDMVMGHLRGGKRVRQILEKSAARTFHLATPPVKESNDHILNNTSKYRGAALNEVGITPAPLRAKLWRLEMSCLVELSKEWGVGFLMTPDAALTPEGYLKPDLYENDATHANAKYGAMVLQQLADQTA